MPDAGDYFLESNYLRKQENYTMKLYINGRFLTQRITGVQRYAIEIVKCLDELLDEKDDVTILMPPEVQVHFLELKRIKQKTVGKFTGHLWIQISLPLFVKKNGGELLSLSGTAPIFLPGFWTVHDITFIRQPESFDWKFRAVYRMALCLGLKRCKKIFTVSEFSKNEIVIYFNIPEDRIQVAYSSANYLLDTEYQTIDVSKFGVEPQEYYLSVSSRNLHKNQNFIVKLARKYPEKKFVIVGGQHKSFNSVTENDTANLIYTGYVSDDELASLYKFSKGFIFPSIYEGFGLPPLEAIVQECRSVALSDISVFREIYDQAYFFDPNDVESFSFEKFNEIDITEKERKQYIEKYSFSVAAKIYKNAVESSRK